MVLGQQIRHPDVSAAKQKEEFVLVLLLSSVHRTHKGFLPFFPWRTQAAYCKAVIKGKEKQNHDLQFQDMGLTFVSERHELS